MPLYGAVVGRVATYTLRPGTPVEPRPIPTPSFRNIGSAIWLNGSSTRRLNRPTRLG
jgi:hypothetical protein